MADRMRTAARTRSTGLRRALSWLGLVAVLAGAFCLAGPASATTQRGAAATRAGGTSATGAAAAQAAAAQAKPGEPARCGRSPPSPAASWPPSTWPG